MPRIESNRDRIVARAHAKVNLALAVGPPRPAGVEFAGYHPIASWMHAIELHDDIAIARSDETSYDLAWADGSAFEWDTASDLSVRAHRSLEASTGRTLPVSLTLRKRIPAGGGLGGGSSDAAAVLLALRDLFELAVSDEDLISCAHGLGTDIPFFVDPEAWRAGRAARPAVVSGLGDRIDRVARLSDPVVLLSPPFGCATGAVYTAFDAAPTDVCDAARVLRVVAEATRRGSVEPAALFNDLTGPAERVEPRLAAARDSLREALGQRIHLSGSGSTLFCLPRQATAVPDELGVRVSATRLI
ncbi:MAG: hypothetical protein AAGA55_00545 [Planctomycetota bacterium]